MKWMVMIAVALASCTIYGAGGAGGGLELQALDDELVFYAKGITPGEFVFPHRIIILSVDDPEKNMVGVYELVGKKPIPPDNDLKGFIGSVTEEGSVEVSSVFTKLAAEIKLGKIRGSAAIVASTKAEMGKIGGWNEWTVEVITFLLDDLNLMSQGQWEKAYLVIAEEVKP